MSNPWDPEVPDTTTCPQCSSSLFPNSNNDPDATPWLCFTCYRGWWNSQLVPSRRASWDRKVACDTLHYKHHPMTQAEHADRRKAKGK